MIVTVIGIQFVVVGMFSTGKGATGIIVSVIGAIIGGGVYSEDEDSGGGVTDFVSTVWGVEEEGRFVLTVVGTEIYSEDEEEGGGGGASVVLAGTVVVGTNIAVRLASERERSSRSKSFTFPWPFMTTSPSPLLIT